MDAYMAAKMRLFREVVDADGTAVIWSDDPWSPAAEHEARERGLRIMTVGAHGEDLRLIARESTQLGQSLTIAAGPLTRKLAMPPIGAYPAANALGAEGFGLATVWHSVKSRAPSVGRVWTYRS